jgi:transglutaminase-like putative cysteine protease
MGNNVQHFDIPGEHSELVIIAEALVEQRPQQIKIPDFLSPDAWRELDVHVAEGDFSEMLLPSEFAKPSAALLGLASELNVCRRDDPLILLRELNAALFDYFNYVPRSTRVDSPIDEAIESKQGVCQDFAHSMIALVRHVGIPCRYVSGYLHHGEGTHDRSTADATHAWVEAYLPYLDWVGFDPTNNLLTHERYVRTAIGRDYADVPPTRGLYRGKTESELFVAVRVSVSAEPPPPDKELPIPADWSILVERSLETRKPTSSQLAVQQMQQQQTFVGSKCVLVKTAL